MPNHPLFAQRRRSLMDQMEPGSIAIVASAPEAVRNRDVEYPYRQDSDFYYLTGFHEPEAVAVLVPEHEEGEYLLFNRERDKKLETWTGRRIGQEDAVSDWGVDVAYSIHDLDEEIVKLLLNRKRVYFTLGQSAEFDAHFTDWLNQVRAKARSGAIVPREIVALDHLIHEMRLIKSEPEIEIMRQAADISATAHILAMQQCKPGKYEYQIESVLQHQFLNHGGHWAYPSIVAGGNNACVLHYIENRSELRDGDLLLIDAGAEIDYYAADITRTFPVNGVFSEPQRLLYQLVLDAQKAAIAKIAPGRGWDEYHQAAVKVLTQGLVELGLLSGDVDELIKEEHYKAFYMHRTGHWLGMDVHDVGDYKVAGEWRTLQPGMVLTVEPGLYIAGDTENVDPKWLGIGIRIEDDVLVTEKGCEVLTAKVPKEIAEIEALMANA